MRERRAIVLSVIAVSVVCATIAAVLLAFSQLMAASTIFTIPIIILFFFAQKTFIQGISTTGGK